MRDGAGYGRRGHERAQRIGKALSGGVGDGLKDGLCSSCAEMLAVSGVAVVFATDVGHRGLLCSSNPVARALEDLQDTVGQGPSIDAHHRGVMIAEPDLADGGRVRWEAFHSPAVSLGAAAVFSFPMRLGAVRFGVLTMYRDHRGDLSEDQYADASAAADVVTDAIITAQAAVPPGNLSRGLQVVGSDRAELHQATGMVAAQLGIGVGDALLRLRARAYADDRPLLDIARDVVARKLRLD